ncbi:hypothetical protein [Ammoniphilus sp. 3BR4]|uniref:hypothetical protein n=1 Tax=Ammoniphilus sp. 3BR4 TaxID=3158265 RepID=UPI0034653A8C
MRKVLFGTAILVVMFIIGIVVASKAYYPSLPIGSVSKSEVLALINDSTEPIVKIAEENGYEWFITRMEQGKAYQNLKNMMNNNGWKFKDQMGAGFIFEKNGTEVIATTEMWTRKYVICKIKKDWGK